MFDNYHFDLANVLVGALIGAVITLLIRLGALKKLELKLNQIGVNLGIEGFQPQEPPSGVRTGDISGTVHGDIVGRDKHTSNFIDKLQQSVSQMVTGRTGLMQRLSRSFRWEGSSDFSSRLERIDRGENWTEEWIRLCLSNPECKDRILQAIQEFHRDGWEPVEIGFDNHGRGIHVNIEAVRQFKL